MSAKTTEMLAYITMNYPRADITSLMKLSYLIDLVHIKKTGNPISSFKYIRYKYGPFDNSIYKHINKLISKNIIKEDAEHNLYCGEHIVYVCDVDHNEIPLKHLSPAEIESIKEVVNSLLGYGAKALVELTYKTKPMQKLGATIGGNENINIPIDLTA